MKITFKFKHRRQHPKWVDKLANFFTLLIKDRQNCFSWLTLCVELNDYIETLHKKKNTTIEAVVVERNDTTQIDIVQNKQIIVATICYE